MYCPSCGATIKQQDQRYCPDCGATLPSAGARPTAIVHRPSGGGDLPMAGGAARSGWMQVLPADMRNRMLIGAVAAVAAVFLIWVVVNAIVSFFLHIVIPALVVLAVLYAGYRFLRAKTA